LVKTLVDSFKCRGYNTVEWSVGNFESGIYFCQMEVTNHNYWRQVIKMVMIK